MHAQRERGKTKNLLFLQLRPERQSLLAQPSGTWEQSVAWRPRKLGNLDPCGTKIQE